MPSKIVAFSSSVVSGGVLLLLFVILIMIEHQQRHHLLFTNAFSLWGSSGATDSPAAAKQKANNNNNNIEDEAESLRRQQERNQNSNHLRYLQEAPALSSTYVHPEKIAVVVICASRTRSCLPPLIDKKQQHQQKAARGINNNSSSSSTTPTPSIDTVSILESVSLLSSSSSSNKKGQQQQQHHRHHKYHRQLIESDVSRLIASIDPSQLHLIFTDVRSAEAAKFAVTNAIREYEEIEAGIQSRIKKLQQQQQSASTTSTTTSTKQNDNNHNNENEEDKMMLSLTNHKLITLAKDYYSTLSRASIVPCDISEGTSILSCINNNISPSSSSSLHSNNNNNNNNIIFLSGSVVEFSPHTINLLFEATNSNPNLAGVSCLSLTRNKNNKNNNINMEEDVEEDEASSSSTTLISDEKILSTVYSAGFSRSPKYRSTLGGKLVSVLPNQVGLSSDDDRFKGQILKVDAIDFAAAVVSASVFAEAAKYPGLPFERTVEWCPSSLEEIAELIKSVSQSMEQLVEEELGEGKENIFSKKSSKMQQIKRALIWLEGIDSDMCNVRTRFGLRFDEMFSEPISPVMTHTEEPAIADHHSSNNNNNKQDTTNSQFTALLLSSRLDSLLFKLSSIMNDATVQSQIVQGMETVSNLGNSLAATADIRVQVDSIISSSLTTMSFPSSLSSNRLNVHGAVSQHQMQQPLSTATKFPLVVVWDQYCCHCCGFSSEIERFVLPLTATVYLTSHLSCFCTGQISFERLRLEDMYLTPERLTAHPATDVVIWVSHTQPYLFAHPLQEAHPIDYHIARMMFEWSRIEPNWVSDIKTSVNEVWVPGQWVKEVFVQSGVPSSKLFVIPEAVDTHRFNPEAITAFDDIDAAAKDFQWNMHCSSGSSPNRASTSTNGGEDNNNNNNNNNQFIFFSNFKWEPRKGWETMMEAYVSFAEKFPHLKDKVAMYILTFAFEAKNSKDHNEIYRLIDRWWINRKKKQRRDRLREKVFSSSGGGREDGGGRTEYSHLRYLFEEDRSMMPHSSSSSASSTPREEMSLLDQYFYDEDERDEENFFLADTARGLGPAAAHKSNTNNNKNPNHKTSNNNNNDENENHLFIDIVSKEWMAVMPRLCLIVDIIPDDQMDRLYASADAFVIPTRGEGWGLPIIQSMSLAKPVLATRWGGELEFMNDDVSFFIELEGLEQPEGSTMPLGSKWAVPSASHLTSLMQYVVENPGIARAVGVRAREHIVAHFSDEAVRRVLERRLQVIHDFVASLYRKKKKKKKKHN